MKKRMLSTLLALCMVLTLLPVNVLADEPSNEPKLVSEEDTPDTPIGQTKSNFVTYHLDGGNISFDTSTGTVAGCERGFSGNAIIPAEIEGVPVTCIGDKAFNQCTALRGVEIPSCVTSIGEYAFQYCTALTNINIPNSVTSIGRGAFNNCSNLSSVIIPESVTTIGGYLFSSRDGSGKLLSAGPIGGGYDIEFGWKEEIPDNAFRGCTFLTNVTIPTSISHIGKHAFDLCKKLEKVYISNSVTIIEDGAFSSCANLKEIEIPDSVKSIGDSAFSQCTGLERIALPNSITYIGDSAFHLCSNLENISVPEGITTIREKVFSSCKGLKTISIPKTVHIIAAHAFQYCDSLTDIYYSGSQAAWETILIKAYNEPLSSATVHFESQPADDPDKTFTLAYSVNGGEGQVPPPQEYKVGETITIDPTIAPTRNGYIFDGWILFGKVYAPGSTFVMPDKNVILMANWKPNISNIAQIVATSPVNGASDVGYNASNPPDFRITFDRKIASKDDQSYVADVDLTMKDGFSIYRNSDEKLIYTPSQYETSNFVLNTAKDRVLITPTNSHLLFEPETEYYITMREGFIKFEDGSTNEAIKKGDWKFRTAGEVVDTPVSIAISRSLIILPEEKTAKPKIVLTPGSASVAWKSSNSSVAQVSDDGTITGISAGTAKITVSAQYGDKQDTASCVVQVTPKLSVSVVDNSIYLNEGDTANIAYAVRPSNAKVTISSQDTSVVTVSGNKITAVGNGTTSVHILATYGSETSSVYCQVTVNATESEKAQELVNEALKYVGMKESAFEKAIGKSVPDNAWCAAFICRCAEAIGAEKVIPYHAGAYYSGLPKEIVTAGHGTDIGINSPQVGDIVWFGKHVGIVCHVNNQYAYVVHGNWHSSVCAPSGYGVRNCIRNYSNCGKFPLNGNVNQGVSIRSFIRPNWDALKGSNLGRKTFSINCPVEVSVSYDGDVLDSATEQLTSAFGTMTTTQENVTIDFDNYFNTETVIVGTGDGTMDFTATYTDENGASSTKTFQKVPITDDTVIKVVDPNCATSGIALEIYRDQGETFQEVWYADGDSSVSKRDDDLTDWYINGDRYEEVPEPTLPQPSKPSYSNNDDDSDPSYRIDVPLRITGGTVKATPTSASKNQRVTITVKPNYGYTMESLTVTDSKGKELDLMDAGDNKYTFRMPDSKVTVDARFEFTLVTPPQPKTAIPTRDKLEVDGKAQTPAAYKLDDYNYFKLRDLAALLNGTAKQFSVEYNPDNGVVTLTTGQPYTVTGSESVGPVQSGAQSALPSDNAMYVDGTKIQFTAYQIGGYNYFKLRDLGKSLNFYVGWTPERGMFIDSQKPYSE